MSLDAAVFNQQFAALGELAGAVPEATIVLDYIGDVMALDMDEQKPREVFRQWQSDLKELATRTYVNTAIDTFGMDCCMMESNFPADARLCGYVPMWNAMTSIVADASEDEKGAFFHGTASQVCRIRLDDQSS